MIHSKRVISLLPSATEILYELGVGDSIYAVTHRCTYPDDAKLKPKAITSPIDSDCMNSAQIDTENSKMQHEYGGAFVLDENVVRNADPDLVISQNTCQVCAAHTTHVGKIMDILNTNPKMYEMNPHTVDEVIESIVNVAQILGVKESGRELSKSLRARISSVSNRCQGTRPRVMILEWVDPIYTAGHWVPDMVTAAGGLNLISKSGERSRKTNISEIAVADPDIIVIMACGFDVARIKLEYASSLASKKDWQQLRAVNEQRVFAFDADSYSSKPSHRIVTGIEILSKIIHPDKTSNVTVPENSFAVLKTQS